MCDPNVTYLMFSKGKIVITGAKTTIDVYLAWERIVNIARQYPLPIRELPKEARPADIDVEELGNPRF